MLWCKECGHSFDKKVQQTTKPINKSRSPSSANSGQLYHISEAQSDGEKNRFGK